MLLDAFSSLVSDSPSFNDSCYHSSSGLGFNDGGNWGSVLLNPKLKSPFRVDVRVMRQAFHSGEAS